MSLGVSVKVTFNSKVIVENEKKSVLNSIKLGAKKSGIDIDFDRDYILRGENEIVFGLRDCPAGWHADDLFSGDLFNENLINFEDKKDQYSNSLYQSLETRMCRVKQLLGVLLENSFIKNIILIVDEEVEVDRINGFDQLETDYLKLDDFIPFMLLAYEKEKQFYPSLYIELIK